ncbi:aldehyde dehydrogenase family protein, partial [Streptomyces sp. NPDC055078]
MTALDLGLYIDGRWENAESGERLTVHNPARTAETVGSVPGGGAADVDRAVRAAHRAQREWAALTLTERADLLRQASARLLAIDPAAPEVLTREMGKVLAESAMDFQSPPWAWSAYLD